METISIQNICQLDGKETHISSCYSDNKVLTVGDKNISFEDVHPLKNQKWKILLEDDSVYLKNERGYICYIQEKDPDIFLWDGAEQNEDLASSCKWSIGKNGELYQSISDTEERYLWVAADHLRVVSDGYLADAWKIEDDLKKDTTKSISPKDNSVYVIVLMIVLALCFIYFLVYDMLK